MKKTRDLRNKITVKRDALKEACKVDKPASWRVINMLEQQLDSVLKVEERYWSQRARIEWLRSGDQNTRFFHSKASARRIRNRIGGMFNDDGVWVESKTEIESVISKYFRNIFTSSNPLQADINKVTDGAHSKLDRHKVCFLDLVFVGEEVRDVIFDIIPMKAPRKDGLLALFF